MIRDVFQAIADPTRRAIIGLIALQAMTPNVLAEHVDSSRQVVLKHIQNINGMPASKTRAIRQRNSLSLKY